MRIQIRIEIRIEQIRIWIEVNTYPQSSFQVYFYIFKDKILALGGHDGTTRHSSVEVFDPESNQWSGFPSMNSRRSDLAVVTYKGKVYAIGGFTGEVRLCRKFCVKILCRLRFSWPLPKDAGNRNILKEMNLQ
jgi:hypothetical protein